MRCGIEIQARTAWGQTRTTSLGFVPETRQASSYPNLEGTEQTRPFTVEGDELRITNPARSIGGAASHLIHATGWHMNPFIRATMDQS